MGEIILQYYAWLSGLYAAVSTPLGNLADSINLPLVSALLFGLLGATAPCQLSTNVAAVAFISKEVGEPRKVWQKTIAFVAGKVTVYALIGGLVVALGLQIGQIGQSAIPAFVFARRALGPLLIVVGLFMLGIFRFHKSVGGRLTAWLEERVGERRGLLPTYLLGAAFAFTFCPTLFVLFFGLTIPLAVASPGGIVFPGMFALGAAIPLLAFSAFLASDAINARALMKHVKNANVWIQRIAAILFILIGLHEIVLYWLL